AVVRNAACPSPPPVPAPSASVSLAPAQEAKLTDDAGRLDSYATQHFAASYAGTALSTVEDALLVYRKPLAAFDDWVLHTFPRICLVVVDALHSQRELYALQARIDADNDYWRAHGIRINTTSPRVDGSAVEVGTQDVDRAKAAFPARYGPDAPIAIVAEAPVS
ncbi:MAG: hypothetical protein J2P15_13210, partial [Micromonosporaceae bacterium]|nr:hypothetical protein [Micromonosporaceae bacterium]